MSHKTITLLAIASVLALLSVAAVPVSGEASAAYYKDELDSDGQALYEVLEARFAEAMTDVPETLDISFDSKVSDVDAVTELVNRVLAAYYLSDPSPIWLWDTPVTEVEVVTGEKNAGVYAITFTLSVPDAFKSDDGSAAKNAVKALEEKLVTFEGTDREKVSAINDRLRGISSKDDGEAEVSNVYDALVTGKSSSAGIAAAFTCLAVKNGLTAITVYGDVKTSGGSEKGYWNEVVDDGKWYAADSTWNSKTSKNCLLAGAFTQVTYGEISTGFGATHSADAFRDLSAPGIEANGVEWPDERGFAEKYGIYVFGALVAIIVVWAMMHAVRAGDI